MRKRGTFGSSLGTIMVVGGSVIGLGNIWRFPYVAGENGGAAFILIYLAINFLISVPLMFSEFSIGRAAKSNAMRSFRRLSPVKSWQGVGYLGIATSFVILSFYSVIAGWALEFLRESIAGTFMQLDPAGIKAHFDDFVASGWGPIGWVIAFVALNGIVVSFGIEKGIERFNKTAMPMMLVILVIMCINSFFLSGFREGATFLLRPDFSKVTPAMIMQALGQSFFSLSVGMGAMITYGSYIKKDDNMFRIGGTVAISDVTVAILSGLAIFPAVFSYGISPTSGPELVFLTLPNIFAQMPGGQIFAILFFLLLFAAAITSSVSLMEVAVAYVSEEFRLRRRIATLIITLCVMGTATLCALSQMPGSSLTVAGQNLFDLFDNVSSTYMMPLGGLLIVIFAGWVMRRDLFLRELTSNGRFGHRLSRPVYFMIRYAIPIAIAMLFLSKLGWLQF